MNLKNVDFTKNKKETFDKNHHLANLYLMKRDISFSKVDLKRLENEIFACVELMKHNELDINSDYVNTVAKKLDSVEYSYDVSGYVENVLRQSLSRDDHVESIKTDISRGGIDSLSELTSIQSDLENLNQISKIEHLKNVDDYLLVCMYNGKSLDSNCKNHVIKLVDNKTSKILEDYVINPDMDKLNKNRDKLFDSLIRSENFPYSNSDYISKSNVLDNLDSYINVNELNQYRTNKLSINVSNVKSSIENFKLTGVTNLTPNPKIKKVGVAEFEQTTEYDIDDIFDTTFEEDGKDDDFEF